MMTTNWLLCCPITWTTSKAHCKWRTLYCIACHKVRGSLADLIQIQIHVWLSLHRSAIFYHVLSDKTRNSLRQKTKKLTLVHRIIQYYGYSNKEWLQKTGLLTVPSWAKYPSPSVQLWAISWSLGRKVSTRQELLVLTWKLPIEDDLLESLMHYTLIISQTFS